MMKKKIKELEEKKKNLECLYEEMKNKFEEN